MRESGLGLEAPGRGDPDVGSAWLWKRGTRWTSHSRSFHLQVSGVKTCWESKKLWVVSFHQLSIQQKGLWVPAPPPLKGNCLGSENARQIPQDRGLRWSRGTGQTGFGVEAGGGASAGLVDSEPLWILAWMHWGSGWCPGGGRMAASMRSPFQGKRFSPRSLQPLVGWRVCPGGGQREGPCGARWGGWNSSLFLLWLLPVNTAGVGAPGKGWAWRPLHLWVSYQKSFAVCFTDTGI